MKKCRFCRVQKNILAEEILAGISCQRKFRKSNDFHVIFLTFFNEQFYLLYIVFAICHLNCRHSTGNFDETCLHNLLFYCYLCSAIAVFLERGILIAIVFILIMQFINNGMAQHTITFTMNKNYFFTRLLRILLKYFTELIQLIIKYINRFHTISVV